MEMRTFEYRCRKCGKVFDGPSVPKERGAQLLAEYVATGNGEIRHLFLHDCADGVGIADLIGWRIVKK